MVGMRQRSEITIATVAVDLDSNPPLGALFTLVLFPSQVQLEARSTSLVETFSSLVETFSSLVETFSSRAEPERRGRGLSRFPPHPPVAARARASRLMSLEEIILEFLSDQHRKWSTVVLAG